MSNQVLKGQKTQRTEVIRKAPIEGLSVIVQSSEIQAREVLKTAREKHQVMYDRILHTDFSTETLKTGRNRVN